MATAKMAATPWQDGPTSRIILNVANVRVTDSNGETIYLSGSTIGLEMPVQSVDPTPLAKFVEGVPDLTPREADRLTDQLHEVAETFFIERALLRLVKRG